ncbi:hypothetical protein [Staphylococcus hominis]
MLIMIPNRHHIVSEIYHDETSYKDAVKLAKDERDMIIKEQQSNSKNSSNKKKSSSDSNEQLRL